MLNNPNAKIPKPIVEHALIESIDPYEAPQTFPCVLGYILKFGIGKETAYLQILPYELNEYLGIEKKYKKCVLMDIFIVLEKETKHSFSFQPQTILFEDFKKRYQKYRDYK